MCAEIVNLRLARKRRERAERERRADVNRAAHGRSGADRKSSVAAQERARRELDGHRLGGGPERDGDPA